MGSTLPLGGVPVGAGLPAGAVPVGAGEVVLGGVTSVGTADWANAVVAKNSEPSATQAPDFRAAFAIRTFLIDHLWTELILQILWEFYPQKRVNTRYIFDQAVSSNAVRIKIYSLNQ